MEIGHEREWGHVASIIVNNSNGNTYANWLSGPVRPFDPSGSVVHTFFIHGNEKEEPWYNWRVSSFQLTLVNTRSSRQPRQASDIEQAEIERIAAVDSYGGSPYWLKNSGVQSICSVLRWNYSRVGNLEIYVRSNASCSDPPFLRAGPTIRKQQRMRERVVHSTSPSFFFSSCQRRCTVHRDTGDHCRVIPGMFNSQEVLVFLADAHPRGPDR